MQAKEALAQSSRWLIVAETKRGLVTIFYQLQTNVSEAGFHLRFIPCDVHGHLNAAGTVMAGSYEDLDSAVSMAVNNYGVDEAAWMPTSIENLVRAAPFSHAPLIDGRHIISDKTKSGPMSDDQREPST